MATPLKEIGSPVVGDGIEIGPQSTGANNRIITRKYEMRVEDQGTYIRPLINPTDYDVVYTSAVLVQQRILAIPGNKTECMLVRKYAEMPSTWDDFDEMVVTFPGVQASAFSTGGATFTFRSSQESLPVPVRIRRTYFLSNPLRIPRLPEFRPRDQNGNLVALLTDRTDPSSDEYIALASSGQEILYRSRIKRWMGDIWMREDVYARAQ